VIWSRDSRTPAAGAFLDLIDVPATHHPVVE
jgi:hypothetical protein